jgi:6-phosphofructokinase 1
MAASVEARSAHYGVGLVKLMGRSSGFLAAQASVGAGVVDVCLLPEVTFDLQQVVSYVFDVLKRRGHAVVVVAEGAAQDTMRAELQAAGLEVPDERDPSGNPLLLDVGKWLRDKLKAAAHERQTPIDLKYLSPAYSALPSRPPGFSPPLTDLSLRGCAFSPQ